MNTHRQINSKSLDTQTLPVFWFNEAASLCGQTAKFPKVTCSTAHQVAPCSESHKWNLLQFIHRARNSIMDEGAVAGVLPCWKRAARPGGKRGRSCRSSRLIGIHIVLTGYKALSRAHLTFDQKKGKRHQSHQGNWVRFALNTLLTDCRAGMVRRTQTVCRPECSLPCPTLPQLCRCAASTSQTPNPCFRQKGKKKKNPTRHKDWAQDTEFINRYTVEGGNKKKSQRWE